MINKINIVLLNLLINVNIQLGQVKKKLDNNTAIFGQLAIIILIKDFYQFLSEEKRYF